MNKQKKKFNKYLLLTWKKFFWIILVWFLAVVLHNVIYGIFKTWFDAHGGDEFVFFIIAMIIIPIYFIVMFIYTIVKKIKRK